MQVMQAKFRISVELQTIALQFYQLATYFLHVFDRSRPNFLRVIDTRRKKITLVFVYGFHLSVDPVRLFCNSSWVYLF